MQKWITSGSRFRRVYFRPSISALESAPPRHMPPVQRFQPPISRRRCHARNAPCAPRFAATPAQRRPMARRSMPARRFALSLVERYAAGALRRRHADHGFARIARHHFTPLMRHAGFSVPASATLTIRHVYADFRASAQINAMPPAAFTFSFPMADKGRKEARRRRWMAVSLFLLMRRAHFRRALPQAAVCCAFCARYLCRHLSACCRVRCDVARCADGAREACRCAAARQASAHSERKRAERARCALTSFMIPRAHRLQSQALTDAF